MPVSTVVGRNATGWRETEQQIPGLAAVVDGCGEGIARSPAANTTMEACLGAEARAGLHSASYFGPAVSPMAR